MTPRAVPGIFVKFFTSPAVLPVLPALPPSVSESRRISQGAVRRLSLYLRTLEEFLAEGRQNLSSVEIAERLGTTAAQLRKDLSLFGSFGKRGMGYDAEELIGRLRGILGLDREWRVLLVGAGRIGSALFAYPGFAARGFRIRAILDVDPGRMEERWQGMPIEPLGALEEVVRRESIDLAILAIPAEAVQSVIDRLAASGVSGVLNFAPGTFTIPPGMSVNEVDLALELELLSFARTGGGEGGIP